jgi:hypothetical protein
VQHFVEVMRQTDDEEVAYMHAATGSASLGCGRTQDGTQMLLKWWGCTS